MSGSPGRVGRLCICFAKSRAHASKTSSSTVVQRVPEVLTSMPGQSSSELELSPDDEHEGGGGGGGKGACHTLFPECGCDADDAADVGNHTSLSKWVRTTPSVSPSSLTHTGVWYPRIQCPTAEM